jgi:DNA gyrase subunit B
MTQENEKPQEYTANEIQVLEGLEGVRKRPGMYIGDTGKRGLHHLIYEIVDNSVDEALAGHCKNITVTLKGDGSVIVKDDGRGIPTDKHATGKSALELVSGSLHAGGKFEKSAYKVSGGLHGVGLSVVNALSEWMKIEVHRSGKIFTIRYAKGKLTEQVKEVGVTDYRGTIVEFKPDGTIFPQTNYDFDYLKEKRKNIHNKICKGKTH